MPILIAVTVALLAFALLSRRTAGSGLTPPMWFTACGLLVAAVKPGDFALGDHEEWVHLLAEVTLVVVLFTDASRIDLRRLRQDHVLPLRMLAVGLPLTIGFGTLGGLLLFPELGLGGAALVGAVLAPTDAALGQAVVSDPVLPVKVRQTLNVESGLNDGIALPAVLLCLAVVDVGTSSVHDAGYWIGFVARQVLLGPLAGVLVGGLGGLLLNRAVRMDWASQRFASMATLGLALLAFATAESVGGNGFLAAFSAGLVLGSTTEDLCDSLVEFGDYEGQLLALLTFTAFGALLAPRVFEDADLTVFAYAAASLTVIRIVPILISLVGKRLEWSTLAFLGWFGPRGIASILFALVVAQESDSPVVESVLTIVATTVLASVVLHGLTAAPWARWYGRHAGADVGGDVPELPLRHRGPGRPGAG